MDAIHGFAREGDMTNLLKCIESGVSVNLKGELFRYLLFQLYTLFFSVLQVVSYLFYLKSFGFQIDKVPHYQLLFSANHRLQYDNINLNFSGIA